MKVFLIDNDKIIKYMMPSRIDDSFLITYNNSLVRNCLITFRGSEDGWYLKSNGTVNILENGLEIDEVKVEIYHKYTLKVVGKKELIELYFLPAKESLFKLNFSKLNSFSVGNSDTCHICYKSNDLTSVEAMFKQVGDDWVLSTVNDEKYKVYINNSRATIRKLKAGDVIFIGGLKIVYMKDFICVNNPKNSLKITGMELIKDSDEKSEEIKLVSEEEKSVELYNKDEYFVHYPTIRENTVKAEIIIDAPPGGEKENTMPFILTMGSTIVMISSSFIMAYNVGYGFYTGRDVWSILPQMVMCVAMLIGSLLIPRLASKWQKKQREEREILRQEKYTEYLQKKDRELQLLVKNQLQVLNDKYLSSDACLQALNKKNRNFWWCQYNDEEFLAIRLGIGKVKSNIVVNAPEEHFTLELDNLLEEVYKIKNKYVYIDGSPITISLKNSNVTSLICNTKNKDEYVNSILTQLLILHSSLDLKIVILTNEENMSRWDFMKYVPHVFSEDKSVRFFATNEENAKIVSNFLEEELKARKEQESSSDSDLVTPIPYYLVLTDNYSEMKGIPIVDEIVNKNIGKYGFSLMALAEDMKQVPITSKSFVEVSEKDGVVIEKQTGLNSQVIFYIDKHESEIDMKNIATSLANIPVLSKDGPSVLPSSLNFLDMFGVSKIEQLNILNRWQINNPVISLDTVVGVHANGDKFKLDLHEKFHGPHGLIAGSTGSGKSEFIITYILSMIINYHPYEVQFVLIDYKGGGLAGAFLNKETGIKIPHLIGTITNLDESGMNRALVSIQSELNRRQRVFNDVRDSLGEGTIDIYKYQKLYREGVVKKPMAHLFIICDEFAELKQQRPEFMQQLISASRIGRSLGIHLILATQKPSGVVNDQIWANSKFKVCLKVQDRSDSMEMLKRPEAASIKEAGRFYLQVGYNDLFDIGQSGWSGAKYVPSDRILLKVDESINFINNVGYITKSIKDIKDSNEEQKDYGDQLTNIVKYIYKLGEKEKIVTDQLWLPPIPDVIYINDLKTKYNYKATPYVISPIVGEYDDPTNLYQGLLEINLSQEGNLVIYGTPGSGKERFLATLIRSIVTDHTPDEANLYIIDCGSESLKIFSSMPHVGDVVTIDEAEKIIDLFTMASREIDERKDLFQEYAGSYNDYITNSGKKLPLMVIILNNFDVFSETYSKLSESIGPLFRDGYKYGVVFVISAISTGAIRSRLVQYFNNRICLQLSQDADYRNITNSPRGITPAKVFGRGMVAIGDSGYEFQTASFATNEEFTNNLRELAKVLNEAYTTKVPRIPTIPEKVTVEEMANLMTDNTVVPVGYNIDTKQIENFDFKTGSIIPIIATNIDDAKISFVHAIIRMMSLYMNNKVVVIDFANAFPKNMENVEVYNRKEMYENAFVKLYNNIVKSKDADIDNYYFIIGVGYLKQSISPKLYEIVSKLFETIKDYPKSHIVLVDVSNAIKNVMLEAWYNLGVDVKTGIWLGENVGNQVIVNIPNLTADEKKQEFLYKAVIVEKGKHAVIKHVIDMEEDV